MEAGSSAALGVGVNTMSYMWKTSAREALEALARAGYRRFELMAQRPHFDPFMERADALAFARFLRDAGLTVETINMPSLDQNLASASPQMRDYTVRLFERLVDIAQTIAAAGIIVVTGRVNPLIQPQRADLEGWFGEAFERVLRAAERTGVRLLLENIPMGVYPRADQLIAFAERIDSPLGGICKELERLCRTITRPAIANEGLQRHRAGQVVLQLNSPYREGTTHIVMAPLEFMQRLAALVPRPRLHLIRFHGVLAPHARLRAAIVPSPTQQATEHAVDHAHAQGSSARRSWACLA